MPDVRKAAESVVNSLLQGKKDEAFKALRETYSPVKTISNTFVGVNDSGKRNPAASSKRGVSMRRLSEAPLDDEIVSNISAGQEKKRMEQMLVALANDVQKNRSALTPHKISEVILSDWDGKVALFIVYTPGRPEEEDIARVGFVDDVIDLHDMLYKISAIEPGGLKAAIGNKQHEYRFSTPMGSSSFHIGLNPSFWTEVFGKVFGSDAFKQFLSASAKDSGKMQLTASFQRGVSMRRLSESRKPVTLRDLNGLILESVIIRKGTTEIEIPQAQVSVGDAGEVTIVDLEAAPMNDAGDFDGELAVLGDETGEGDDMDGAGEISDDEFTDFEDMDFDEFGEEEDGGQVNLGGEEGAGGAGEEASTEEPSAEEKKEEEPKEEEKKEEAVEEKKPEEAKESVDAGLTTGAVAAVEKPMGEVKIARAPEILIDNLMSGPARTEMVTRLRHFIESMAQHISSQEYRDLATDLSRFRAIAEGYVSILNNNTSPSELVVNTMIDADHLLESWSAA